MFAPNGQSRVFSKNAGLKIISTYWLAFRYIDTVFLKSSEVIENLIRRPFKNSLPSQTLSSSLSQQTITKKPLLLEKPVEPSASICRIFPWRRQETQYFILIQWQDFSKKPHAATTRPHHFSNCMSHPQRYSPFVSPLTMETFRIILPATVVGEYKQVCRPECEQAWLWKMAMRSTFDVVTMEGLD